MADTDTAVPPALPDSHLITVTHLMYGLHAFSTVSGMSSSLFIVTAFLAGWPSIIAVIINYVRRREARGSFLDTHFAWQLRTFWWALLWVVVGALLTATFVGAVIGLPLLMLVGLWVLYRIARGWLALASHKPVPV